MTKKEHIGVGIIVVNDKGRILLGERRNSHGAGQYGIPGGRIEVSEALEVTVKRELNEETSLKVLNSEFVGVVRDFQKEYNFIHFGFVVSKFSGDVKNMEYDKCKGWEWFDFGRLPQNILPGHRAILEMYIKKETPRYGELVNEK